MKKKTTFETGEIKDGNIVYRHKDASTVFHGKDSVTGYTNLATYEWSYDGEMLSFKAVEQD